jgi:hypothetical protein
MTASLVEQQLGDIRWISVAGDRRSAFAALGRHCAPEIAETVDALVVRTGLRDRASSADVKTRFEAIADLSRKRHPDAWLELTALAEGGRVDFRDLLLMNARVSTRSSDNCSELVWSDGESTLLAHNEDGDPALDNLCPLVTLQIDGDPSVATWWYPGHLPGHTFTVTSHGLVWTVDAIHAANPPLAPGQLFVARGLALARTLEEASEYLRANPAAGALTYTFGELGSGRLVQMEVAGTEWSLAYPEPGRSCMWHTNHLRYLSSELDEPTDWSRSRAETLEQIEPPSSGSIDWLLDRLLADPPLGVRANRDDALTLSTAAFDLGGQVMTLVRHGAPLTMTTDALLAGGGGGTTGKE